LTSRANHADNTLDDTRATDGAETLKADRPVCGVVQSVNFGRQLVNFARCVARSTAVRGAAGLSVNLFKFSTTEYVVGKTSRKSCQCLWMDVMVADMPE